MESVEWEYLGIGENDSKILINSANKAGKQKWEGFGFMSFENHLGGLIMFKRHVKKTTEPQDDDSAEVVLIGDRYAVRKKIDGKFKFLDIYDTEAFDDPHWNNRDYQDFETFCTVNTKEKAFKKLEWLNKKVPAYFGTPVDPDH